MHKIDSSGAVSDLPTANPVGTPGYFSHGNPGTGTPYTVVSADWANAVQGELTNVIETAGITLDKTDNTQLYHAMQTIGRIKLAADLNLYVATTGSDSNDGLGSGTPVLTVQKAVNIAYNNYDMQGYNVIINVADGTYTVGAACANPLIGGGSIFFVGNVTTPANCYVNLGAAGSCFSAARGASIFVHGFKMGANNGSNSLGSIPGVCLACSTGGSVYFGNCNFAATQRAHMEADAGGVISCDSNYTISGGATWHYVCGAGTISVAQKTITITGTPAFSGFFAYSDAAGNMFLPGNTYSGSATGARYNAVNGGSVATNSGNTSYLPGNASGSSVTGYYT